ncbi:MAG: ABC transporter ATP-binding protein [Paludibacteraceae bacterium]|nr:ABC transporter ATP-binding protein [Paludibacteraceae bacterium]
MSTAIEFSHVSKQYRLGLVSTKTLSHDIRRFWITNVLGKEDPYLKIGETNDRASKGNSEYVWALRDIDFKVEQGDVVGIIGKNGAGKSTLLKLLSRVTGPTTGTIRAHGRIGSLLEVGTGFHGEMTGRENIFMNGAILGMSRAEIQSKLDEIIDFSGCERYIDTPVKRYSSGMTVRLGFAVAAFLEPEILVVDEVLAVGDAEFQKKAIGKMKDVSQGQGRTVLFVSHNMASIRNLCKTGIVLDKGQVKFMGTADQAVDYYLSGNKFVFAPQVEVTEEHRGVNTGLPLDLQIMEMRILNDNQHMATDEPIKLEVLVKKNNPNVQKFSIGLMINNSEDARVGSYISPVYESLPKSDEFVIKLTLRNHNLAKGTYTIGANIGIKDLSLGLRDYDVVHDVLSLEIVDSTAGKPIALWQKQWGSINFQDAAIEIA